MDAHRNINFLSKKKKVLITFPRWLLMTFSAFSAAVVMNFSLVSDTTALFGGL